MFEQLGLGDTIRWDLPDIYQNTETVRAPPSANNHIKEESRPNSLRLVVMQEDQPSEYQRRHSVQLTLGEVLRLDDEVRGDRWLNILSRRKDEDQNQNEDESSEYQRRQSGQLTLGEVLRFDDEVRTLGLMVEFKL